MEDKGAIIPINVPNSELDERQQLPPMTEQGFNITFQILIWKKETAKA